MANLKPYVKRYFERYNISQFFLDKVINVLSEELYYKDLNECCDNDSCTTDNYKQTLPQTMNKYLVSQVFYKHVDTLLKNIFKCGGRDCCGNQI
jgi:hypothetical protein